MLATVRFIGTEIFVTSPMGNFFRTHGREDREAILNICGETEKSLYSKEIIIVDNPKMDLQISLFAR